MRLFSPTELNGLLHVNKSFLQSHAYLETHLESLPEQMTTPTTPSYQHPPTTTTDPPSPTAAADKLRLTEQEKKSNHIASEQKRRQAIREGFDEIADLVPGLQGQGRSEAIVLQGATAYMRKLLAERWQLVAEGRRMGVDVGRWVMDDVTMRIAAGAAGRMVNGNGYVKERGDTS